MAITASLSMSLIVCGGVGIESLGSRFGRIDDHEPLAWMGREHRLPMRELWPTYWSGTEVGGMGAYRRWRPAYYAMRVLEAAAFGDEPMLWHLAVLVIFVATSAVTGYVLSRWAAVTLRSPSATEIAGVAAVGATLCAGMAVWRGLVGALGPSEPLGLLGAVLAAWGMTELMLGGLPRWWFVAVAGSWLAVLSKESFVAVPALSAVVWAYGPCRDRADRVGGLAALMPVAVLGAVLLPHLGAGDVYGQPTGASRIRDGASALVSVTFVPAWCLLTVAVVLVLVQGQWIGRRAALAFVAWCVAALAFDAWIFGTYRPFRYRAMLDLVILMATVAIVLLSVRLTAHVKRRRIAIVGAGVVLVATSASLVNLGHTASSVSARRANTAGFDRYMSALVDRVADSPGEGILIVTVGPLSVDLERTTSTIVWVARGDPTGRPVFVAVDSLDQTEYAAQLRQASANGDSSLMIRPYGTMPFDVVCVLLGERTPPPPCEPSNTVEV